MGTTVKEESSHQAGAWDDEVGLKEEENTEKNKHLLFNLAGETYGLPTAGVTEIIEMQRITQVPDLPKFIKGVINLRGRVVPVMDLRLRFHLDERPYDDRTCMVVVKVSEINFAIIVDTVAEVHDLREEDVDSLPELSDQVPDERCISGLGKIGDTVAIVLDIRNILEMKELESITKTYQTG